MADSAQQGRLYHPGSDSNASGTTFRSVDWLLEELLEKIPGGYYKGRTSTEYPRERRTSISRRVSRALSNLERQLIVAKQYLDVPNRKRSIALFRRIHGIVKPMDFPEALTALISKIGPVRLHTLRFFVSRPVEELAEVLRDLEDDGKICKL